ncbi:organic cation transporter protein-like isoform X1 [Macrobrachium rosenbergii]|uniref:organic cation transporter protein-like isoform X1 n=1 Tax=Macrobrachium rosenbergii TaxID=79674 RepID=UPI0034D3FCA7
MEAFLEKIGEFGRYQKTMFLLLSLPTIIVSMQKLAWVFLGARVDHRCRLPWEYENTTYPLNETVRNASYPWDDKLSKVDQCHVWSDATEDSFGRHNDSVKLPCDDYIYDRSKYETSAVMDFDLVCDRAYMRAAVQSVYMFGMLIGSYLFGDLSDRFGRKPIFLSALVLMVFVGVGQAAIPNYYVFTALRLVLGASLQGVFLVAYVMAMELVGKKKRVLVGVLSQFFYTLGYFMAAFLAFEIKSWRWLQISMTLPALLFIPYYWVIPESTRWLITKGRSAEAKVILEKAAKINKKKVTEEMVLQAVAKGNKDGGKGNFFDLFRFPNLRRKTLNLHFNWFVNSGVYYGLSLNTGNLGGNDYLNFIISGAVELPAHAITILILDRVGRRLPLCSFLVLGGIALLSTMFVTKDLQWLLVFLAMFGKLCITASYAIIYVLSAEIFPTVVRNVGVGSSSMVARIGGAIAPFINLLGDAWKPLPLLIFGSLAFAAGILSLLLPETLGRRLPETIEDGESFGSNSTPPSNRSTREQDDAAVMAEAEQVQALTEEAVKTPLDEKPPPHENFESQDKTKEPMLEDNRT